MELHFAFCLRQCHSLVSPNKLASKICFDGGGGGSAACYLRHIGRHSDAAQNFSTTLPQLAWHQPQDEGAERRVKSCATWFERKCGSSATWWGRKEPGAVDVSTTCTVVMTLDILKSDVLSAPAL